MLLGWLIPQAATSASSRLFPFPCPGTPGICFRLSLSYPRCDTHHGACGFNHGSLVWYLYVKEIKKYIFKSNIVLSFERALQWDVKVLIHIHLIGPANSLTGWRDGHLHLAWEETEVWVAYQGGIAGKMNLDSNPGLLT